MFFAGPSVLAGLAVMIILIPVNGVIANHMKTLQIKQMKYKDERVKLMNEVELSFRSLRNFWSLDLSDVKTRSRKTKLKNCFLDGLVNIKNIIKVESTLDTHCI